MNESCVADPKQACIGLGKAMELEHRIKDLEEWRDTSRKFHSAFYDWQRTQIARDARLDAQLSTMNQNIDKVIAWQEQQQTKPAKRLDAIVDKLVWAVLAAVAAFILGRMGL